MPDDWRKIERGLFESADGRYRIANPHKLTTELRHRWLVAERRTSGSGWCLHDGDHATLHDPAPTSRVSMTERQRRDPRHREPVAAELSPMQAMTCRSAATTRT